MEKGIEDLDFNEEDYGIAQEPSNPNGYVPDYESLSPPNHLCDVQVRF